MVLSTLAGCSIHSIMERIDADVAVQVQGNPPVGVIGPPLLLLHRAKGLLLCLACRAKIMVVSSPKAALKQLAHHLHGVDNVPVAYGGNCTLPFEAYPGHKKLLEFVARLNKL